MTTEHYRDPMVVLLRGDVRDALRTLDADSVQACVTSPPYWSLRDYGIAPSVWGGSADCAHEWIATTAQRSPSTCASCACGAWRGCLGLEPTPDLFVAHMVEVFREVRRVLRPDGTCWINIGDSYAAQGGGGAAPGISAVVGNTRKGVVGDRPARVPPSGLKPKDLVGIPWMLAFALRADGWWLRQDIIWSKPNPMPESVTDRCTKAHEYMFLLTKSATYYYDADAIAEKSAYGGNVITGLGTKAGIDPDMQRTRPRGSRTVPENRNKRDVWTVPSAPFAEAHFATFPPALIEPCILAGATVGATVLDPFAGSGTTAMVSKRLNRKAIGIDLNGDYLDMAVKRVRGVSLPMPL